MFQSSSQSLNQWRIQPFDLICRHNLDLWLPVAKSDCARDADGFPLDRARSLICPLSGTRPQCASEGLVGVFSCEIDKCGPQWAGPHTDNATSNVDFFADIPDGFRVFYHYLLVRMRHNRAEKQCENCK
jgi:hypothetical protein